MNFESSLEIDNGKKVDVVISLLQSHQSQKMTWHNQAYVAATASLGLMLVIVKLWLDSPGKSLIALIVWALGIILLEYWTRRFLNVALDSYNGNEEARIKCEYALRLKENNIYFAGNRFYWKPEGEDRGMTSADIPVLRTLHWIASAFLIGVCVLHYFKIPR